MSTAFLDTSAVVDWTCKSSSIASQVQKIVNSHDETATSLFVKLEFKRGFLQHIVYLHNKLSVTNSFATTMSAIHALSGTPQRNKLSSCLELIRDFFSSVAPEMIDDPSFEVDKWLTKKIQQYLRNLIRFSWACFLEKYDAMAESPLCTATDPTRMRTGLYDNRAPKTCNLECGLADFFRSNATQASQILKALKEIPEAERDEETKKRIRELKRAVKHPGSANDTQTCRPCGDAIVVMQCPDGATVVTSNKKHFQPICQATNTSAQFYRPTPSAEEDGKNR